MVTKHQSRLENHSPNSYHLPRSAGNQDHAVQTAQQPSGVPHENPSAELLLNDTVDMDYLSGDEMIDPSVTATGHDEPYRDRITALEVNQMAMQSNPQWVDLGDDHQPPFIDCPDALTPFLPAIPFWTPFEDFAASIPDDYQFARDSGNLPPEQGPWQWHCPSMKLAVRSWNIIEDLLNLTSQQFSTALELVPISMPLPNAVHQYAVIVHSEHFCEEMKIEMAEYMIGLVYNHFSDTPYAFMHESGLRIGFGHDCLKNMRTDGGKHSRLHDIHQQSPLISDKRVHVTLLTFHDSAYQRPVPNPCAGKLLQAMTYLSIYLRTSLRLNPDDITFMIASISRDLTWQNWPLKLETHDGTTVEEQLFKVMINFNPLQTRALIAAHNLCRHMHGARFLQACEDFDELLEMGLQYGGDITAADYQLAQKWIVCLDLRTAEATRKLRTLRPSFYHEFEDDILFDSHVHVVDFAVRHLHSCMIIGFEMHRSPSYEEIKEATESLCRRFDVCADRAVISAPMLYGDLWHGPVFRVDGMTGFTFVQKVIAPNMRTAVKRSNVIGNETEEVVESTADADRIPQMVVIWLRKSTFDEDTDLAYQAWTVLSSMPQSILPLTDLDHVLVAVENCSSLQHGWYERNLVIEFLKHMRQMSGFNVTILTAWADRLTRRLADVDLISDTLDQLGATWLFRISAQQVSRSCAAEWHEFGSTENALRVALKKTHSGSSRITMYNKNNEMQMRMIHAPLDDPVITAMRGILTHALQIHDISVIILYARCTLNPQIGKAGSKEWIWQVERQIEVMQRLIPSSFQSSDGSLIVIRDGQRGVNSCMDRTICNAASEAQGNSCVLSVSIDRIVTKSGHLPLLREELTKLQRSVYGMCLLWDQSVLIDPMEGLDLCGVQTKPSVSKMMSEWVTALDNTHKFESHAKHLSILQPIFWCTPKTDANPACHLPYEESILSQLKNTEGYGRDSASTSQWISYANADVDGSMPKELSEAEPLPKGQYFSDIRQSRWTKFIASHLDIREDQVQFIRNSTKSSFTCNCKRVGQCSVSECSCQCTFCKAQIRCMCLPREECMCNAICSCSCQHCHKKKSKGRAQQTEHVSPGQAAGDRASEPTETADLSMTDVDMTDNYLDNSTSNASTRVERCDRCITRDLKCSRYTPCTPCTRAKVSCTYSNRQGSDNPSGPEDTKGSRQVYRTCIIDGCDNPVHHKHVLRCPQHETQRVREKAANENCLNPACDKKRHIRIRWCSLQCYIDSTPNIDYCQVEGGCQEVVPPGLGKLCETHSTASRSSGGLKILRRLRKEFRSQQASSETVDVDEP